LNVAEEVRHILADLGVRRLEDVVGRSDLLARRATLQRRAGLIDVLAWASSSWIIGREKLAVLPVPVWAAPITSRPCSRIGIAFAWIGVGCT